MKLLIHERNRTNNSYLDELTYQGNWSEFFTLIGRDPDSTIELPKLKGKFTEIICLLLFLVLQIGFSDSSARDDVWLKDYPLRIEILKFIDNVLLVVNWILLLVFGYQVLKVVLFYLVMWLSLMRDALIRRIDRSRKKKEFQKFLARRKEAEEAVKKMRNRTSSVEVIN